MADYISRKFNFERSVPLTDIYAMLTGIADRTESRWEATSTSSRRYESLGHTLDAMGADVKGRITRDDLELEFDCDNL